jgi:hypothetical protein
MKQHVFSRPIAAITGFLPYTTRELTKCGSWWNINIQMYIIRGGLVTTLQPPGNAILILRLWLFLIASGWLLVTLLDALKTKAIPPKELFILRVLMEVLNNPVFLRFIATQ